MREVTVERFVAATPVEVERALSPAVLVEYEGSFAVRDVEDDGDGTLVTASARGVGVTLRFSDRADGFRYEQVGDAGPFDAMWTEVSWGPENEGTRVTATSAVRLGLPFAVVWDRVGAWKRRGELRRALGALAADLE